MLNGTKFKYSTDKKRTFLSVILQNTIFKLQFLPFLDRS